MSWFGRIAPRVSGVITGLFGRDAPEERQIDFDKNGNVLYKADIIGKLKEELERRRSERAVLELQWSLNANFLVGNQFCDINPYSMEIEQIEPTDDSLEREKFNQIAPLIETRVANLKKISYNMRVKPRTSELDDYDKAETSTAILQHTQKATNFNQIKDTAIWWNEVCGNVFWLSWWDPQKGEPIAEAVEIAADSEGNEVEERRVYRQGDIDYGLITPYELFPENLFKQTVEAQRSIILEQVMTVDDILDLYGVKVNGGSVNTFSLTPLESGGGYGYSSTTVAIGSRTVEDAAKVITYFERPSRQKPNGQMIIVAGDEELVYYGDLPYSRIPIVQMICREVPGQFFGKSAIEDLIPRQRAYNGVVNRIHEYIKRTVLGNVAVAEGSIDLDEYADTGLQPGKIIVYNDGFAPPTPIPNSTLPGELMQERYNLKNDMEYVAGTSQLMVNGATPSGVTSGTAIQNLMEIDNTRLSLTGDYVRKAVRELAILWLEIYKKYATTQRVTQNVGANAVAKAITWSREDITSFDVDFITENELLLSEDAQRERFIEAYNMGLFTDSDGRIPQRVKDRVLEYTKIGNYGEVLNINTLQIQYAQRENAFFEQGVIPEVSEFDEHEIHIDEHMRYILQMDFQIMKLRKPEYAKALEDHIKIHKEAIAQEQQQDLLAQMAQNGGIQ